MLTSVQGIYRGGKIELAEQPSAIPDETRVIVTFLTPGGVDLRARGMTEAQTLELRAALAAFAEEWESPEMEAYDDYDAARSRLSAR